MPVILTIAGQEVLGAYSVVMQIIGYGLVLDFGLSVAISRFLSQSFCANDEGKKFTKIFNVGRYFTLVTNFLFFVLLMVLAFKTDAFVTGSNEIVADTRAALFTVSAWTLIRTPLMGYGHGLLASQNMATINIISLATSLGRLTLSLYFVYIGFGLLGLVLANILLEFISLFLQKYYFHKMHPNYDLQWRLPDVPLLKELFNFGIRYWGVNLASVLTVGSDSIIIGHLYGVAIVAIYYTTKIPTFLSIQVIYKISDNAGPGVNELLAQGNLKDLVSVYVKILRYSLLVAIPLAIGVVGFNEDIITLWVGSNQYAGSLMSLALASFVITQVVSHINAMITVAVGNMRNWVTLSVAVGIVTLIFAYTSGRLLGMQWVMVAIALMDIPPLIFLINRAFSSLNMQYIYVWHEAILPVILAAIPPFGCVVFVTMIDQVKNTTSLMVFIAVFATLWLLGLYNFGINKLERNKLKKIAQERRLVS